MINSRGKRVVREAVFLPPLSLWELRTKILMKSASAPMFIRCFRNQAKVPHMLSLIPNSTISASESLKRRLQLLLSWGWWRYLYPGWFPRYRLENPNRTFQSLRKRYKACHAERLRFSIRYQCRFIQIESSFHQYLTKHSKVVSFFLDRFEETYSRINMKDLEESIEWIGYAVNDMDNTISEIDYNAPMTFFDIEKSMGKVISKELKSNSLK